MSAQPLSDLELFSRVAEGTNDPVLWQQFLRRFSRLCFHAIHRVFARDASLSPGDADELFQTFCVRLLADDRALLRRFRGDNSCSPGTYLAHLAAYEALDHLRRIELQRRRTATHDVDRTLLNTPDRAPAADVQLQRRSVELTVQEALQTLSPSDQLLFRLHYQQGYSLVEVARITQRTETAVHVQHFRLKERFKRALERNMPEGMEALAHT